MLTERTRVRRRAARGNYDPAVVHGILDEALVCHVGFVVSDQPFVLPTAHARVGDQLYFHGAFANRTLEALAAGVPCCVTATLVDGLVLARSAFHHSMNYRSAVVLGKAVLVTDPGEKRAALNALVERLQPGRSTECRPPTDVEIATTALVRLPIEEASAKVRTGPPVDSEEDRFLPFWAGVIPTRVEFGTPEPDAGVTADADAPRRVGRGLQSRWA